MSRGFVGLHLALLVLFAVAGVSATGCAEPLSRVPTYPVALQATPDGWTRIEQPGWFHDEVPPGKLTEQRVTINTSAGELRMKEIDVSNQAVAGIFFVTEVPRGFDVEPRVVLTSIVKALAADGYLGPKRRLAKRSGAGEPELPLAITQVGPYARARGDVDLPAHTGPNASAFHLVGEVRFDVAPDRLVLAFFCRDADKSAGAPTAEPAGEEAPKPAGGDLGRMIQTFDVE